MHFSSQLYLLHILLSSSPLLESLAVCKIDFFVFHEMWIFVTLIKGPLAGANFIGFVTTPSVTVLLLGSVHVLVALTRWMDIWWGRTLYGAWGALRPSLCRIIIQNFGNKRGLPSYSPHSKTEFKNTDFWHDATGHHDTGFSWFPCVYKQMLRWFPTFQVATTCFSCSPPDLNLVVTNFMFCIHVK